ncbi:pentatricopeptide repeat-containing protein [Prunus yedoensis var. nudiflora]|uniref:Pentatricopeptide repeat-containing protein n=1 Tax=Prunus yedoensis var. nudiflora TaxID=2094558 RepID=A0A315AC32_PRUYE|nr:pentatricopeptide repeat-containing protein [Prunus yedoensis var. nudiflora]
MMRKPKPIAIICCINHPPEPFLSLLLLIKPFSSSSTIAAASPSLPPVPEQPLDLSSQLFAILSRPNWQRHPSLKKLIPSISPSHVSSLFALNLDPQTALGFFNWIALKPGYRHTVHCHSSLLNILIPMGSSGSPKRSKFR